MHERRFLSDVARQFRSLDTRGERIAVLHGFGKEFRDKRYSIFHEKGGLQNHFQGIGRIGNHLFVSGSFPWSKKRSDLFVFRLGTRAADPGPWGSNLVRGREPSDPDRLVHYFEIDKDLWHAGSFAILDSALIVPLEGDSTSSRVTVVDVSEPDEPVRLVAIDFDRPVHKGGVCAVTPLPGGHVLLGVWTDADKDGGGQPLPFHFDLYVSGSAGELTDFRLVGRFEPDEDHGFHRQFQGLDFVWEKNDGVEKLFLLGFENTSAVQPNPTDPGENRAYLFEVTLPEAWMKDEPVFEDEVVEFPPGAFTFITARVFEHAGDWYNMDAGASAYVDSNQQLILYAVYHFLTPFRGKKKGDVLVLKCVEYRAHDFTDVIDHIEDAWIELYEGTDCSGRRVTLLGPLDASFEDTKHCFCEDASFQVVRSARFQIPEGRAFILYRKKRFEGEGALVLEGDGTVRTIEAGDVGFDGNVGSFRFLPLSVATALPGAIIA
ncbi:MAG: hypothetical protein L0271_21695 [Gemmatimonadetes bacterium]|nr:hypothetical protein [Gemmatimonadota bacterium]